MNKKRILMVDDEAGFTRMVKVSLEARGQYSVEVVNQPGEALAAVKNATAVDAVVMASAAQRGDIVYTSDVDDLERLRSHFPAVRVLGIG